MELLTALVAAVLFGAGVYLMLARGLLRVVMGTVLLGHAVNLLLMISGRLKRGGAPIVGSGSYADPLPQALILTAIVIGFGVTAVVFVLAYRTRQEEGSDDLEELRGLDHE